MRDARILVGDVRERLRELPAQSVQCVVTSPPYWGLRDYGHSGQIGLERSPIGYVAAICEVFAEVWRVLRDDGTVFLNLGDSYFGGGRGGGGSFDAERRGWRAIPCGTSGKAPEDSPASDCLCGSLCGACRVAYQTGKSHSGGRRVPMLAVSPSSPSLEHRESAPARLPTSDCLDQGDRNAVATVDLEPSPVRERGLRPSSQVSTLDGSSRPHPAGSRQLDRLSGCRLCGHSLNDCAPAFDDKPVCTCGTAMRSGPSDSGTSGTVSSGSAHQNFTTASLKPKDLVGIPWRVAFALQAGGWYLRSDIIWSKPNPMPESVTDRPTKAHEYIFLLTKSERYYFDAEAIREPLQGGMVGGRQYAQAAGLKRQPDGQGHNMYALDNPAGRNKRSVWHIATQPYPDAHFATYPEALIEPCILAGSKEGDTVLDPFCGSGTTGVVACRHNRNFLGVELNPAYAQLAEKRILGDAQLLNRVEVA
jgi:DNA modification methylase